MFIVILTAYIYYSYKFQRFFIIYVFIIIYLIISSNMPFHLFLFLVFVLLSLFCLLQVVPICYHHAPISLFLHTIVYLGILSELYLSFLLFCPSFLLSSPLFFSLPLVYIIYHLFPHHSYMYVTLWCNYCAFIYIFHVYPNVDRASLLQTICTLLFIFLLPPLFLSCCSLLFCLCFPSYPTFFLLYLISYVIIYC